MMDERTAKDIRSFLTDVLGAENADGYLWCVRRKDDSYYVALDTPWGESLIIYDADILPPDLEKEQEGAFIDE